jgi:poly-gamma-glutamate synthesis protein (capsule biosynthesis protein)
MKSHFSFHSEVRIYKVTVLIFIVFWGCQSLVSYAEFPEFFTLIAVGDIMLSRGVGNRIDKFGLRFPFEPTANLLRRCDITFANLESQISTSGEPMKRKEIHFRAQPHAVFGLMYAGIDVVSLANNHALDYGAKALFETMDILAKNGIAYVGAGMNFTAAHRAANFVLNDIKISFLAYSANFYLTVEATAEKYGVAVIRKKELEADIKRAKKWADIVVVSFHWGWEYSDHPTDADRAIAHLAIDSGANLIIGHHAHVIQGVEAYKGGLICYNLGNFIFDQRGTRTRRGLILRCDFSKSGLQKAELLPIQIHPQDFRPELAAGRIGASILWEVKKLSRNLNTEVQLRGDNLAAILVSKKTVKIGKPKNGKNVKG